ncbi:hypothetical protein BDV33DRAFT_232137 [Aspergillus novoparasiticus]|uniref:Fatty acyl-CoA reductase n=1 Tax=Aspergillus novoparasiticus TaxID=986946 RepID=A0A5N6F594_9EURO|nr:hypothetical protein BDV33DRAFT_232137 [Aspergillus novoparasiticus]
MWEYYEGKLVLDTGGSGFLGTTIVHRLVMSTSLSCIYLVCRGGTEKLLSKWRKWLPPIVNKLYNTKRLIVLDDMLRDEIHIIIHAASSINLGSALKRVSDPIIEASEMIASLAFTCKRLDHVQISEEIYEPERQSHVLDELNEHYLSVHASEKLLIVRPALTREVRIATKMDDPDSRVTIDEVPVDVVADRLLCHLAMGMSGCIHAVSGVRSRLKFEELSNSLMKLRRIPASFNFSDNKPIAMCQKLSEEEQQDLQLFTQIDISDNLLTQTEAIRFAMNAFARKRKIWRLIVWLF